MTRMYSVGLTQISMLAEWYDRNPNRVIQRYIGGNIAPHGTATRWTYTVPAGKKAFLEVIIIDVIRRTAATTVGQATASIFFTPSGGSGDLLFYNFLLTNTTGDRDKLAVGTCGVFGPGDVLEARTVDSSTGGACDYVIIAKITEFNV